jgi:hypothetical protein
MRPTSLMLFIRVAAAGISVSPAAQPCGSSPIRAVRSSTMWCDSRRRASAANLSSSTAPACRPARWRSPSCRAGRFALRRRPCLVFTPRGVGPRTAAESQAHLPPRSCTRLIPPMCANGSPVTAACPNGLSSSRVASSPLWCRPATLDPPPAPTRRARQSAGAKPVVGVFQSFDANKASTRGQRHKGIGVTFAAYAVKSECRHRSLLGSVGTFQDSDAGTGRHARSLQSASTLHCGRSYKMFFTIFPSFMMTTKFFPGSSISLMLAIGSPSTSKTSASAPCSTTPSSPGYGLRLPDRARS